MRAADAVPRSSSPLSPVGCCTGSRRHSAGHTTRSSRRRRQEGRVGLARKSQPVDVRPAEPGRNHRHRHRRRGQGDAEPAGGRRRPGGPQSLRRRPATRSIWSAPTPSPSATKDRSGRRCRRMAALPAARAGDAVPARAPRRRRLHLYRPLGRGDGGAAGRRDRPRPGRRNDTYRVASGSFDCTYEIIEPANPR